MIRAPRGWLPGRRSPTDEKARKIKTAPSQMCRIAAMRCPAINNRATVRRLRRGLNPTPDPQPVDAMARAACFSRRQFHRLMVQLLGETPGSHQRRLRLDRGAWLLLTSRATVLEIALQTGFENHETFTRAFRLEFGETPSAFRKNQGRALPPSLRIGLAMAMDAATHLHGSHDPARTKNKS